MNTSSKVFCPLLDETIEDIECMENSDCVKGAVLISSMPDKFKSKNNWKSICENCEYHEL